jgi:hypothetical protein
MTAEHSRPLPIRAAVLPVFETEPHSAEQAVPTTTSAGTTVPDALSDVLTDPDMARIAGAWPTLPGPFRRAVFALVSTALPETSCAPGNTAK